MNNKLKNSWKNAVVAKLCTLPVLTWPVGGELSVRIRGLQDVPNAKQYCQAIAAMFDKSENNLAQKRHYHISSCRKKKGIVLEIIT
jgi:hypothetical protein